MPFIAEMTGLFDFFWPLTDSDRKTMFTALLVTSVLGTLSFLFLRKSGSQEEEDILVEEEGQSLLSPRLMYSKCL